MLRNLTDIFPGLRWTASNNGRTAVAAIPLAGPIELSLTSAGSIAMRLPEDGLFKKELTLSPDSAVVYLARWAAEHHTAVESAMGLRPRSELAADLAALRERMRWVPVGERFPDDHEDVPVAARDSTGKLYTTFAYKLTGVDGDVRWFNNGYQLDNVTHWQPMPAAPEVSS